MNTSITLVHETPFRIPTEGGLLHGDLARPAGALGLAIFAHGSGSGRHSPRNQFVARTLHRKGVATLLFDLLTEAEEREELAGARRRFDVEMLAGRLADATRAARSCTALRDLPFGYFGASTGAAAALRAAARLPEIAAVVSRGGRTDLADTDAPRVKAATLLIVGGLDTPVLEFNRHTLALLGGPKHLTIIPHASHLFPEPGALDEVAGLAATWFSEHFSGLPEASPCLP